MSLFLAITQQLRKSVSVKQTAPEAQTLKNAIEPEAIVRRGSLRAGVSGKTHLSKRLLFFRIDRKGN